MAEIKYKCPECEAVLKVSKEVPPGKKLRCPKCDTMFAPVSADQARRPAPARSDDDDEEGGHYQFQEEAAPAAGKKGDRTNIFEEPLRDRFPKSKRGPAQATCTGPSNMLLGAALLLCLCWLGFIVVKLFPIIFYENPWTGEAVLFLLGYAVQFVYACFIVKGAVDMQNLDSYKWSVISSYMGIAPVPLLFLFDSFIPAFFWLLTLGAGIYCLETLRSKAVYEGLHGAPAN